MRRFNGRLAALPGYDDFTHFAQPMFSLEKAQGTSNAKKVKIAVNWRCVEYEHLVCQLPYVTPEHKELTQLALHGMGGPVCHSSECGTHGTQHQRNAK